MSTGLSGSEPEPARLSPRVVAACALFALLWAVYPFARSFFRCDVDYNEGWNVYNAQLLVQHRQIYPVAYGWQTVNYPIGSFELMAFLHRFTHEYLFTARIISLLALVGSCWLAGLIVRELTRSRQAAVLTGFLVLGVFCTDANAYVGMDDPQLLAQVAFMLAFYLYVRSRKGFAESTVVAALFVLAGSIKHNPLDFPLAVLVDLLLLSWRRAAWFAGCGVAFGAVSVAVNLHWGGPFFISQMLAPRIWSVAKLADTAVTNLGPLLMPLLAALLMAWSLRRDRRCRVLALLLVAALGVGTLFGGGAGVSVNTFFSSMVAMSMLLGVLLAKLEQQKLRSPLLTPNRVAAALFGWLLIPALVAGVANPFSKLREAAALQQQFDRRVALLRGQPSPQLCESLLECYAAGQPYVYDPFNATRLVAFGKLNPALLVDGLERRAYGAVELEVHEPGDTVQQERFPAAILEAIRRNYTPVLTDPESTILLPRR